MVKLYINMAADVNELEDFLFALKNVFDMSQRSQRNPDPKGIEHYKNKIEHYILIVVAMKVAVDENTPLMARIYHL